jgi:hypothetical protein
MRIPLVPVIGAALLACGGDSAPMGLATAPVAPPITQVIVSDLVPVGATSFAGLPGGTAVLQVRALRADGGPAPGASVVFKVQAGGGTIQPIYTSTDGQGIASASWTLGTAAAVNLATATGPLATSTVSFTVSTFPSSSTSP